MVPRQCMHKWQEEGLECPYGFAFLTVTFPDSEKPARMHAQHPSATIYLEHNWLQDSFLSCLFALYGWVVYIVVGTRVFELIYRRICHKYLGTRELSFALYLLALVVGNELILKNIFQQPRPERSCLTTCGMPSGHAAISMGYFTLNLMDIIFRVSFFGDENPLRRYINKDLKVKFFPAGFAREASCDNQEENVRRRIATLGTPMQLSSTDAFVRLIWYTIFLVPVPLSRVAVWDHTPAQVLAGTVVGIGFAVFWFVMQRWFQSRYFDRLGQYWWLPEESPLCSRLVRLFHNFALPVYLAKKKRYSQNDQHRHAFETWYLEEAKMRAQIEDDGEKQYWDKVEEDLKWCNHCAEMGVADPDKLVQELKNKVMEAEGLREIVVNIGSHIPDRPSRASASRNIWPRFFLDSVA